jgi:hypothetical protein
MSTIDEIRGLYKDKFDANNPKQDPSIINLMNFAEFEYRIEKYKFEKRIEDINIAIKEAKNQDTNIIEECAKQLNDIKLSIDNILKQMKEDKDLSGSVLFYMKLKYDYYQSSPEGLEAYQSVGNSMLKENVEKLIKYEKIFIIYNEKLIDINKQLKVNN